MPEETLEATTEQNTEQDTEQDTEQTFAAEEYVGLPDNEGDAGQESGQGSEAAVDSGLIERAGQYGLSAEDIEGWDESRLNRVFTAFDNRIMSPAAQPQQPVAQPSQQVNAMPSGFNPLKVEFGEEIDEALVGPLKSLVEQLNVHLGDGHKSRQDVKKQFQRLTAQRRFSQFDRWVESQGDGWAKEFGSGNTLDLDPNSAEFQTRLDVFLGGDRLLEDSAARGQKLKQSEAWNRSHHGRHWNKIEEKALDKVNKKVERRQRSFGERATKGKEPAMTPKEAAIVAMRG